MPQREFTDESYKINLLFTGQTHPVVHRGVTDIFIDENYIQFTDDRGGVEFYRREVLTSFYIRKLSD